MNILIKTMRKHFATLAIAEHNGKVLTKNTLKLLNASSKLKEEVTIRPFRPISWFVDSTLRSF